MKLFKGRAVALQIVSKRAMVNGVMSMKFKEEKHISEPYKMQYLEGLETLVNGLEQETMQGRVAIWKDMMIDKEKYRLQFAELLGWPLTQEREHIPCAVVSQRLSQESDCIVERMQFTVLKGVVMTGLLFCHDESTKRPFVLIQHGGSGTPELISGAYGSTSNYNDMLERVFRQGANVFAPQLLLWSKEQYQPDYDREVLDSRLKNVGSSITAVEVYFLMRVLDYFAQQPWVGNIGMVGLSYGGFYTQLLAALDTRIKASVSCSYFCDAAHWARTDWSFRNIAKSFGEAELACLVHPRKLFLEMGNEDNLFDYRKSIAEYERIRLICGNDTEDWLEFTVFDGNHEFYKEDKHIEKFMAYLRKENLELR